MSLADAAVGASESLHALMVRREMEKQTALKNQLALMQNARADKELALRGQELAFNQQHQLGQDQASGAQHMATEANTLGDQIPGGTVLSPQDTGAQIMERGGRGGLLTKNTTLPSTTFDTMGGSLRTQSVPSDGQVQSLTKQASSKQIDTTTDNARQQAQVDATNALAQSNQDRLNATATETSRHNRAMESRPTGQGESFDDWKRKQDYTNQNKPTPKLPQREDDTVVSIHQMTPLIDELLSKTQSRMANTAPKGMMGTLGEKAGRLITKAEYSAGLPVAPADSERIQLASLLQILGTVPYLRGIRNMQFVQQIQQHLADPSATDASIVERLQTLKRILPGMEQAIYDVHNGGVIPHEHPDAAKPDPLGIR